MIEYIKTKEGGGQLDMALIKCPECGKEISDKASSCPNCGCPIEKTLKAEESENKNQRNSSEIRERNPDKLKHKNGFGKTLLIVLVTAIILFGVIVVIGTIFGENDEDSSNNVADEKQYITDDQITQMFSDPNDFKGKYVKLSGQIFVTPEEYDEYVFLQVWNEPNGNKNNFIVNAPQDGTEYESNSYIIVDGMIEGEVSGENLIGGTVSAPLIRADNVELSNYKDVVTPTIKEVTFDSLSIDQYGYTVEINKIEYAENETRLYVALKNNGKSTFYFYDFNMKITQEGKQYDGGTNYEADYPEIQPELLPGSESFGVVVFPAINQSKGFDIYAEGSSDNWEEEFQPYKYSVTVES